MKTKFLFTMILFSSYTMIYGQEEQTEKNTPQQKKEDCKVCENNNCNQCDDEMNIKCDIIIDLNDTKTIRLPKKIKPGQFYRVVVKNVNLNNYFVSVNNEDSNPTTALELPIPGSLNLDNLAKLTNSFNQNVSVTEKDNTKLNQFAQWENVKFKTDKEKEEEEIKKKLNDFHTKLTAQIEKLKGLNTELDSEKMKLYEYRLLSYSEKSTSTLSYDYATALQNFKKMRADIETVKADIKAMQTDYETYLKGKEATITNDDLKKNVSTLKKMFEESNKAVIDFKELVSADNVEKLLTTILNLTSVRCYISAPIQFTKEQTKLKVELTPKAEKSPLPKHTFGPYIFPTDYDTYWSVGTSLYYAFGLTNERYSVVGATANGTTTYQIVEEDNINSELGIVALLRYGKKNKDSDFGKHLSLGTGLSIEKTPRPRLMLGGGISIGHKHNFTIDAGLIAGYTDGKSKVVDTNTIYTEKPGSVTITELSIGGFISFGYMFKIN